MESSSAHGPAIGLGTLIREDYVASGGAALSAGFHAVATYRFGQWAATRPQPGRAILLLVYRIVHVFVRNLYGIELPLSAEIGRRLHVAHQGGIVLNPRVRLGDDCLVRQNTTIGVGGPGGEAPTVGDRVQIGAGAVLVGGITIGHDVHIGPNAVVMTDVPNGGSAFAPPARLLKPTPGSPDTSDASVKRRKSTTEGRED
jgi:serine O-acetyltransferase